MKNKNKEFNSSLINKYGYVCAECSIEKALGSELAATISSIKKGHDESDKFFGVY